MSILNTLIRLLMSNPRASGNVINWLAESWPIRSAARLTARMYLTSKNQIESRVKAKLDQEALSSARAQGFKQNFQPRMDSKQHLFGRLWRRNVSRPQHQRIQTEPWFLI